MSNSLEMASPPPPRDGIEPQQQQSALAPQGGLMPPQGQPQAQRPAPTHAQTVAALRHLQEIGGALQGLLENPKLGRSDIKSDVIDSVTKLVSDRVMSPAQAVIQLATVPTDPLMQRKWVDGHLQSIQTAQDGILEDHRSAHNAGVLPQEDGAPGYDPENHMPAMDGIMSHYKGRARG